MGLFSEGIKKTGGKGLYLDIEPGQKVRVRLLGAPTVSAFANPDGKISYRFNFPVWDYEGDEIKILSKGRSILTAIDAIADEYGDDLPMQCDLVISRKGSGLETEYTVVPGKVKAELPGTWDKQMPDMLANTKGSVPYDAFVGGTEPVAKESTMPAEQVPVEAYNDAPEATKDE